MLSASVAHAMELMGDPAMTETIRFVRYFDRFFDCLNVSSLSEGRHTRKPDLYPYRAPNDKRFTVSMFVDTTDNGHNLAVLLPCEHLHISVDCVKVWRVIITQIVTCA